MTYKITHRMTYKEFGKEVENLRLGCGYGDLFMTVYDLKHFCPLVYIHRTRLNRVIVIPDMLCLPKNVCFKLLTLCCKLARTPLDERGKLSDL